MTLEANTHRKLPFETLQLELQLDRKTNNLPGFQVMFTLNELQEPSIVLQDLAIHTVEFSDRAAKVELFLDMVKNTEKLTGY